MILKKVEKINSEAKMMNDKEQRDIITVYGKIELVNQEMQFLALCPKYTFLEAMDMRKIRKDGQAMKSKIRRKGIPVR